MASTRLRKYESYDASLSRSRYGGAVSHGNVSVIWWQSHSEVGCWLTSERTIFRSEAGMVFKCHTIIPNRYLLITALR
jgi:hypothetical protein